MTEKQNDEMTIRMGERRIRFEPVVPPMYLSTMEADELEKVVRGLNVQIDEYCAILAEALYARPQIQESLFARLQKARKEIDEPRDKANKAVTLNKVIFEIHRIHAIIVKEQELILQSVRLRWLVPALVIVYITAIIGIIVLGWEADVGTTEMPVIGIPVSVLLWSAIGSVAAILYRFYTYRIRELGQVSYEIRWLIARPIIGIIMGMASYIVIVAGLFIFGAATQSTPGSSAVRPQLLWAVAFLAGFSDKFFEGFIRAVVSKLSSADQEAPSIRD